MFIPLDIYDTRKNGNTWKDDVKWNSIHGKTDYIVSIF